MLSNINELHAQFIEVNYGAVIKNLFDARPLINVTAAQNLGMGARKFAMNGALKDGVEQLGVVITEWIAATMKWVKKASLGKAKPMGYNSGSFE